MSFRCSLNYSCVIKVAADTLKNFMFLLDNWFCYKERLMARAQPCEVQLHPHTGVDIADVWDDLQYEHYTLNEPEAKLPLGIFEAQPVGTKKPITLNLQIESEGVLSIVVTGNTYAFKDHNFSSPILRHRQPPLPPLAPKGNTINEGSLRRIRCQRCKSGYRG